LLYAAIEPEVPGAGQRSVFSAALGISLPAPTPRKPCSWFPPAFGRLQDVYCGEFKSGLTGNEILGRVLRKALELGIPRPRVYSHSMGLFLHEPGPLIGLPWEQVNNPGRGDVKLVPMSTFVCELSVTGPLPEWGVDFRPSSSPAARRPSI
jgi:hypothetical protein